jgi:hypothetical protein
VQDAVTAHGKDWAVHHIEDAEGPLSIDYYSLHVQRLPYTSAGAAKGEKRQMTALELFKIMVQGITGRPPPWAAGNLLLDTTICVFNPINGTDWSDWDQGKTGASLVISFKAWKFPPFDRGCIVLSDVSMGAEAAHYRVSTFRAGPPLNALAHPVSGNREFGFLRAEGGYVFYIIGADRPTRFVDKAGAYIGGFAMADALWRRLRAALQHLVDDNGGISTEGLTIARRIDWETAVNAGVYDVTGQPAWRR